MIVHAALHILLLLLAILSSHGLQYKGQSPKDVRCAACAAIAHTMRRHLKKKTKLHDFDALEAICKDMDKYRPEPAGGLHFLYGKDDLQVMTPNKEDSEDDLNELNDKSRKAGLRGFCEDFVLQHEDVMLKIARESNDPKRTGFTRRSACVTATASCSAAQLETLPDVRKMTKMEQTEEAMQRIGILDNKGKGEKKASEPDTKEGGGSGSNEQDVLDADELWKWFNLILLLLGGALTLCGVPTWAVPVWLSLGLSIAASLIVEG